MNVSVFIVLFGLLLFMAFAFGRSRSQTLAAKTGSVPLTSLPFYYGMLTSLWAAIPALILLIVWSIFEVQIIDFAVIQHLPTEVRSLNEAELGLVLNKVYNVAYGRVEAVIDPHMLSAANAVLELESKSKWLKVISVFSIMLLGAAIAWVNIKPEMRARVRVEQLFRWGLLLCSLIAILTTIGILLSVIFESLRFFQAVPITDFLFGAQWSPQTAIRVDQVTGDSSFGAVPLFTGTLLIASIAMIIAVPTGLMSAIYLSEYAAPRVRAVIKPLLEILAGVPTVVYGFFAALTVGPFIRDSAISLGLDQWLTVSSESALAAGLVMGVMIIPFVSSLSDDVINAVPQSLRDGSLGLGATESETIKLVVIPAALPGIVGGVLLAVSRAIGETMIVVMAAGLAANLTANPLDSVTTVTVQIVTLLVGDQEFDSPKTLAAFALGLMLFLVTLLLNYLALHIVRKYREQYE
ncbi:MAG: phosphate transport system permease protein [Flavobacteriales bacterium]|jgi:phosphate transport system permease protein